MEREIELAYKALGAGIVLQAIKDLRSDNDATAIDALYWMILSSQAVFLLESLGFIHEPDKLIYSDFRVAKRRHCGDYNRTREV